MTTYVITASNWNQIAFWAAIAETVPGHTLDFSGLGPGFSTHVDQVSGIITISDGVTSFTVGETGVTGTDATLGGTTLLDYFTTISGAQGNDRVSGSAADEVLDGNAGNDRMDGAGGNDTLYGNGGADQLDGGDGNDLVHGGADGDEIHGGAGDDALHGETGDDTIHGDAGRDFISGGAGADLIFGGAGDDHLEGGWQDDGADTIWGGTGNDLFMSFGGDDSISGEAGSDWMDGGHGNDLIDGGADNDRLLGDVGNDTLLGGAGYDVLTGGEGADRIDGGDDADQIWGNAGDTIFGGEGGDDNDTLYVSHVDFITYTTAESGTITFNSGDTLQFSGIEQIVELTPDGVVDGTAGDDEIGQFYVDADGEWIDNGDAIGEGDGDSVRAGGGNDTVWSNDGNDTVHGEAGDDYIYVGAGDNVAFGGAGSDTIDGEWQNDTVSGDDFVATGPNLIANGSFEDTTGMDASPGWGFSGTGGTAPGWTDANGFAIEFHADGRGGLNPTDGTNWADLEANPGQNNSISQTVAGVQDGQVHVLTFDAADLSNINDGTTLDNQLQVIWNGDVVGTIDASDGSWTSYEFHLIGGAGDGTNTLTFAGLGDASGIGASLDNVQMYVAAEGVGGDDSIDAWHGDDDIMAGAGDDTILAGDGADLVVAGSGHDSVLGGDGDDTIWGGTGNDVADGGGVQTGVVSEEDFSTTPTGWFDPATGEAIADTAALNDGNAFLGNFAGNGTGAEQVSKTFTLIEGATSAEIVFDFLKLDSWDENSGSAGTNERFIVYLDGAAVFSFTPDGAGTGSGNGADASGSFAGGTWSVTSSGPDTEIFGTNLPGWGERGYQVRITLDTPGDTVRLGIGTTLNQGGTDESWGIDNVRVEATGTLPADGADTIDAGAGNDLVHGGAGNDSISGGAGDDTLFGGAGNDTLSGRAGDDLILGGAGNDSIRVSSGNDTVDAGEDNDIVVVTESSGISTVDGGLGADTIDFSTELEVSGWTITATGDGAGTGTHAGGSVVTYSNMETILGSSNDDLIDLSADATGAYAAAEDGNDTLIGGIGDDNLRGRAGNDSITTGDGRDTVSGGDGADIIAGGAGADRLDGGADDDTFIVEDGFGNDTITGGDTFTTGVNYDTIDLSALSNPVVVTFSGPGAGTITDFVTGDVITFSGIEQLILTNQNDLVDATLDAGHTYIQTLAGNDSVQGSPGDDIYDDEIFGPNGQGNDTFIGGAGDDEIWAGTDDDSVSGGAGSDTLNGQSGNDTIDGGTDADSLYGGIGDDSVTGGDGDDLIQEFSPGGTTVNPGDTRTGTNANESFVFAGDPGTSATIILDDGSGTANDGDVAFDTIYITSTGNGASLTLEGFSYGVDRVQVSELWTGLSSSEIAPGHHRVILSYDNGNSQSFDIFHDNGSVFDPSLVMFTYAGRDTLEGGAGNDTLDGAFGDDSLSGGTGDDWVLGGADDDTIGLGNTHGADTIIGGEDADGGDRDVLDLYDLGSGLGATVTYTGNEAGQVEFASAPGVISDFSEIEVMDGTNEADSIDAGVTTDGVEVFSNWGDDTVIGGSGADSVYGGLGADSLSGGDGADLLAGQAGDDTIGGGAGNDLITGGDGTDTFTYAVGDGLDTITDFNFGNTGTLDDGIATNNDAIDLSTFYDNIAELHDDHADDGVLNQSNEGNTVWGQIVDYSDNTRFDTDGIAGNEGIAFLGQTADGNSFTQENTGVICFTPGTLILTETGAHTVEALRRGDRIVTRDNGVQTLQWLAQRWIGPAELLSNARLRPVLMQPDLIGAEAPLLVSPQHGVLLRTDTGDEMLVRAIHLARLHGGKARVARGIRAVTYIHLMFDAHQIVFANGAPTESFYPGPTALAALSDPARDELGAIYPDLFTMPAGRTFGQRARSLARQRDLPPSLHDLRAA